MIGIYMLDTLQMFKLIQQCIPQTWLIPGKLSIFPIIGTLLKKLITTGKNPLKNKMKLIKNVKKYKCNDTFMDISLCAIKQCIA